MKNEGILRFYSTFEKFQRKRVSADPRNQSYTIGGVGPAYTCAETNLDVEVLWQQLVYFGDDGRRWTHGTFNDGASALYVRLSKTLIAVKTTKSVWAEEGVDAEEGTAGEAQYVVITGEVMLGTEERDIIESVEMQPVDGVEDVEIHLDESATLATISFVITSSFDVTQTRDAYLLFHSEKSGADGVRSYITFVPSADGKDGAQGESGMDAFSVQIFSESGNLRVPENGAETIYARVFRGGEDITESIRQQAVFRWIRKSGDAASDQLWNEQHAAHEMYNHPALTLTDPDIVRRAMFECEVTFDI